MLIEQTAVGLGEGIDYGPATGVSRVMSGGVGSNIRIANGGGVMADSGQSQSPPIVSGMFRDVLAVDLEDLMDIQLRLQVDVSFNQHHAFLVQNGLDTGGSVLDLGTGNGYFDIQLAQQHPEISFLGLDLKEGMIARARESAEPLQLFNLRWLSGDFLQDLPEINRTRFDGILLRYTAIHMPRLQEVLRHSFTLLNPGGRIWIIDVELDLMEDRPPHPVFDLYRRATEGLYLKFGLDGHVGSRLPTLLEDAGFTSIVREVDDMSNAAIPLEDFQRFMLHETRLIHEYAPDALSTEDLSRIGEFVETVVPTPGYYCRYGVVMISGAKREF